MYYRILSILGLQGFEIISVIEYYREVFIFVYPKRKTGDCPNCGKRSKALHEYRPPSLIRHYKLGRRQTYLVVFKRRFFCKDCQKPFTEVIPGISKWQRKTKALEEEIIEALRESSFAGVERKLGVGYQAQVKLLKKAMKPFEGNWLGEKDYQGDLSLGLDEHSFSGHDMVLTITNLTFPRLISILPDDRKATLDALDAFCQQIPPPVKDKIKSFCIDMKAMYRSVIKKNFPQAKIIIDHFHLIYDANKRIDEERRIFQQVDKFKVPRKLFLRNKENLGPEELKKLNWWFARVPDLKVYWFVKESLREMYQLKDKKQAQEKLITLIKMMYGQRDRGLTQWADTLTNWQEEILNFFDYRITNAYTEGIHTKLKLIKRLGFGFKNKQVYIRKAALACLPLTLILPHFS